MANQAFFDRVEAYTVRASVLYPGQTVFNKRQLAAISGRSPQTIYNNPVRYCFRSSKISIKEFVRMEVTT